MVAARAQGVAAILCSSLQPCVPPSVRAKRQEPLVPATAPSLPAGESPSHMGAIGGVDAALLPTNQDPAPMAGSAVSCRPHPRQEPSALTRTLGSVRRGAGQPALLPRRSPAMGIPTAILWRNCAPTSQPKGRGWKPSAYGCARQRPTRQGIRATYWTQRQVRVTHLDPRPRRRARRCLCGERSRTSDRRQEPDVRAGPSGTARRAQGNQRPYRDGGQQWPFLPRPFGSLPSRAGYDRSPAGRLRPWKRQRQSRYPWPIATRTNTQDKGEVQ